MTQKSNTAAAIKARGRIGRATELRLLDYLERHQDMTIYDLSKALNWSTGKTQKAIERVKDDLNVEEVIERGRLKKKYRILRIDEVLDMDAF